MLLGVRLAVLLELREVQWWALDLTLLAALAMVRRLPQASLAVVQVAGPTLVLVLWVDQEQALVLVLVEVMVRALVDQEEELEGRRKRTRDWM